MLTLHDLLPIPHCFIDALFGCNISMTAFEQPGQTEIQTMKRVEREKGICSERSNPKRSGRIQRP